MERHEYIPGIMYLKMVIVLVVICFVGRKYSEVWVCVKMPDLTEHSICIFKSLLWQGAVVAITVLLNCLFLEKVQLSSKAG